MLLLLLCVVALLAVNPARADTAGNALTLQEALRLAAQNNRTLQSAAIDIEVANARLQQARGREDFVLGFGADTQSMRTDAVTGVPFQQTEADRVSFSSTLMRPLPFGGKLGLRFGTDVARALSVLEVSPAGASSFESETYSPSVMLQWEQPLLRGFGLKIARADQRRAQAMKDVRTLEREGTAVEVIRDVVHAYWEMVFAAEQLEIRRSSLELAQEHLRQVQNEVKIGRLAVRATAEVEATIALREEEVLLAEQAASERSLTLSRLIGMDIGPGSAELHPVDRPDPPQDISDLESYREKAIAQNAQLSALRSKGIAAEIEVEVARNGLLPQLDLTAAVGPTGSASDFEGAFEQLGDSFAQLTEGVEIDSLKSYGARAGLTFSIPLGMHSARAARDAAKSELRKVKLNQEELAAQVGIAVVRAVNGVKSAKLRGEVLEKSAALVTLNLESEQERFKVGKTTNFEVLKRQDELAQTKLRQVRAGIDYVKAVAVLESLTGDILPRHGIVLVGLSAARP